jgi:NAD(P)-dependent dehydrogenase (short-subunit alcohol dehydrogenase family)
MTKTNLDGKAILVTGAARRIGRALAIACARAGADVVIHYGQSSDQAAKVQEEIAAMGRKAWTISTDLGQPALAAELISQARKFSPLYALVNSAAIFEPLSMPETKAADWERHLAVNLTAPFLLSQAFAKQVEKDGAGRIVNILDWRALRPGADHFPYTISKAALAALTKSLAVALAPNITVNGLALGAILPPSDRTPGPDILHSVPANRWAQLSEVEEALIFLLTGPAYITGEIMHVDGGRHLV